MSLVANWSFDQTRVDLFRDGGRLKFSAKTGSDVQEGEACLHSYEIFRARKLVEKFRGIIEANLKEGVSASSFVPVFCWNDLVEEKGGVYSKIPGEACVALFGRIDKAGREVLREASWGVLLESSNYSQRVEMEGVDEALEKWLRESPESASSDTSTDQRHRNRMNEHARVFMPVLERDSERSIRSVSLKRLFPSKFNAETWLDERHWAVTVVSARNGSGLPGTSLFCEYGHSMIACEGIRDGLQFLEYAHLTTLPNHEDPEDSRRSRGEARVEIRTRPVMGAIAGPTWPRPRNAVERMLRPIREAADGRRYVPFSRIRDVCASTDSPCVGSLKTMVSTAGRVVSAMSEVGLLFKKRSKTEAFLMRLPFMLFGAACDAGSRWFLQRFNCVRWVEAQLPAAGIIVTPCGSSVLTPGGFVKHLNENPSAVTLEELQP